MTSFIGHLLPGAYFWLLALWFNVNVSRDYLSSLKAADAGGGDKADRRFRARPYYMGPLKMYPLESVTRLAIGAIMVVGELFTARKDGEFITELSAQHMTMKASVGLAGLFELLVYHKKLGPLIDERLVQPVGRLIYFATGAFLFYFHLHGRSELSLFVHVLVALTAIVTVACIILEGWVRRWPTCSWAMAVSMMTFGSWLIHAGYILFPEFMGMPAWNGNSAAEKQLVILLFSWHYLANVLVALLVAVVVNKFN